jgi:hypothetical protein
VLVPIIFSTASLAKIFVQVRRIAHIFRQLLNTLFNIDTANVQKGTFFVQNRVKRSFVGNGKPGSGEIVRPHTSFLSAHMTQGLYRFNPKMMTMKPIQNSTAFH